jgi:flagellin-like protein
MPMQKRGISSIVATVLIVLITVASVSLLWAGLYPMINRMAFTEDVNLRLTIDGDASYTTYDKTNGFLSVRIKRGSDKANVVALKFLIDIEGNSQVNKRYIVPEPNTAKVYAFGVGFVDKISSVKVVPIYNVNGEEIEGAYFSIREKIPTTDGDLSDLISDSDTACASEDSPGLSDGLVLYYDFEQTYGAGNDQLFDLSCRGHTGTLQATAQVAPDEERGSVIQLNGGYVDLAERESLATQTGDSKTIAFWAKPECKGSFESSVVFGSYRNYYVNLFDTCGVIEKLSFCFEDNGGSTSCFDWSDAVYENEWHHYALTIKTTASDVSGKLFIDGEKVTPDPSSWPEAYGVVNDDFYFGTHSSGSAPISANLFIGSVDEFRIYNEILTSEEIASLYATSQK